VLPISYDVAESSNQALEDLRGERYLGQHYDLLIVQNIWHRGESEGEDETEDDPCHFLYHPLSVAKSEGVDTLVIVDGCYSGNREALEQELKAHNADRVLFEKNGKTIGDTIVEMLKKRK